ncbi:MAG: hypothetical protein EBV03_04300 [Proteobacteria bacterium]|nr:hypothetical protein [Pseudomonadota bacterium]
MSDFLIIEYDCNQCERENRLQVNFEEGLPLQPGCIPFPEDGQFYCPGCNTHHDLSEARRDLELAYLERIKR